MTPSPYPPGPGDRLPPLPLESLDAEQRAAAEELIAGPRKAVLGPFIPLLRSPELLARVQKVGEYLLLSQRAVAASDGIRHADRGAPLDAAVRMVRPRAQGPCGGHAARDHRVATCRQQTRRHG